MLSRHGRSVSAANGESNRVEALRQAGQAVPMGYMVSGVIEVAQVEGKAPAISWDGRLPHESDRP